MQVALPIDIGPLNQLGIQLISAETAVHLATGASGWLVARLRAHSLADVLKIRKASLATVHAFNILEYTRIRQEDSVFGTARQYGGRFISTRLPSLSRNQYENDAGMACLYAIITALLCFFDDEGVCRILMEIFPKYLVSYEQDDVTLSADGPLNSAMRSFIRAVNSEEQFCRTRENLLRKLDKKTKCMLSSFQRPPQECEVMDDRHVIALLTWVVTKYSVRESPVYLTRSFYAWAVAELLSSLGFGISVSETAITTQDQYAFALEGSGLQGLPVHFVGASVGKTDPGLRAGQPVQVAPLYRLVSIRTIPELELSRIFFHEPVKLENTASLWKFTFNHVQKYLRALSHIQDMVGTLQSDTTEKSAESSNRAVQRLTDHQRRGLEELSRSWSRSSPQSLEELLYIPISRWISKECEQCKTGDTADNCWTDGMDIESEHESTHNEMGRLLMKAILLAASYAIVTLFVRYGDDRAGLDAEVVTAAPSQRRLSGCFKLQEWCTHMMSVAAVGQGLKGSTRSDRGRVGLTKSIFEAISGHEKGQFTSPNTFGCYSRGISIISQFLLDPCNPHADHIFVACFGRMLDLPLGENNLVKATEEHPKLAESDFRCAVATSVENSPECEVEDQSNFDSLMARWDIEPDWQNDEESVHFRCRVNGIPQCTLAPSLVFKALKEIQYVACTAELHLFHDSRKMSKSWDRGGDGMCCFNIPFQKLRQAGQTSIKLHFPHNQSPKRKSVAILEVCEEPLEQALALYTKCAVDGGKSSVSIKRFRTHCLLCGLEAIRNHEDNRPEQFQTVYILVVGSAPRKSTVSG